MIIIKLQGGLGNQMFQYAFGRILAKKSRSKLLLDYSFFDNIEKKPGFTPRTFELKVFENQYKGASQKEIDSFNKLSIPNRIRKKYGFTYPIKYIENYSKYNPSLLSNKKDIYLQGYFQSYKYFVGYENFVRSLFSFNEGVLSEGNRLNLKKMKEENSVSIHIRRGDYASDSKTNAYHGLCSLDYYQDAISLLESRYGSLTLFFFSDDMEWVKRTFKSLKQSKHFITNNKDEVWADMLLMSSCKHNIIANSSFSWWGAWLNKNTSKTVIAPKRWNNNEHLDVSSLLPEEWIKL